MRSDLAVRWCLHLGFRDAVSVIDMTYGGRRCWSEPLPPGIVLTTNDIDPARGADFRLDYRATGLPDRFCDLALFDPPHTGDNGKNGHFGRRYGGTAKGNAAVIEDVVAGAIEAWRVASVGIIVKIIDSSHGSEWISLADAVKAAIPMRLYFELVTVKRTGIPDPKHRAHRVPGNNGAIYLLFRRDGHKHRDFDKLYRQQQARISGREQWVPDESCDFRR